VVQWTDIICSQTNSKLKVEKYLRSACKERRSKEGRRSTSKAQFTSRLYCAVA